jgi:hypothetical protein
MMQEQETVPLKEPFPPPPLVKKKRRVNKVPRAYTKPRPKTYIVQRLVGEKYEDTDIGVHKEAGQPNVTPRDTEACLKAISDPGVIGLAGGTFRIIAVCREVRVDDRPVTRRLTIRNL